jgi:DNA-directed RNA polymerase II subunit RPB2
LSLNTGLRYDGTPFSEFHAGDHYEQQLESFGFQRYGDEVMYSGKTGEQLRTECAVMPMYYQRLKHMVEDKIHARAFGPIQLLTRQPAEGRSRDGGHRIGEMERDCFIAHGVAHIIQERMIVCSDLYRIYTSRQSQSIIPANPDRGLFQWNGQDILDDHVVELQVPYAFVLLMREMQSAGIDMRITAS